jgi:hypothetical protein
VATVSNPNAAERRAKARRSDASGNGKGAGSALRPDFRVLAIGTLIGLVVSLFLILLLLEPPASAPATPGGVSIVEKTLPSGDGERESQADSERTPRRPPRR